MRLSLACGPYDRALPLIRGEVKPRDLALDITVSRDTLERQRRIVEGEFDVAECYLGAYIADRPHRSLGMTAIPIFVKRMFRHSYLYINRHGHVAAPKDLNGSRIGIQSWFTTTSVWMKGILSEEYGVDLASISWVSQSTESHRGAVVPDWANVEPLPEGESLKSLLLSKKLDLVISTGLWAPFDSPDIDFLFPDYPDVERDYFSRTGFYPIMHVLVIRDEILERHPWVAMSLFDAWQESKAAAMRDLAWQRVHLSSMWYRALWEEEMQLTSGDTYPWGFERCEAEVDKLLAYSHDQGLTQSRLRPQDLFHPSTLST